MKKIILGIIILMSISCNEKSVVEFSLKGTTNEIEDGTVVYLENHLTKELIDSVSIQNNSFNFKTKLAETPLQVILRTKDFSEYRFIWLENSPMIFDARKSEFRHANITGSKSENLSQALDRETDTLPRKEKLIKEMAFVENNPNSIVSANLLSVYSTTWGKEKTKELFDQFSKKNKNSEYGNRIANYIELNKEPKIGDEFLDFEMMDNNDNPKKLSEVKGKTILLEFWSSWCGPCRIENPNLVKTYEKFNPKGFEIFAVSLDVNKESWIKAIEQDNLNWRHVSDLKGQQNKASLIYGINGIPDNFLITENGIIIGRNLRGEKLNEILNDLLE
ncbi:AhpC/TSA family protein [Pontimicrobium sp. SW4]|uniref:AhpC/TSA family protein n=1 Tax=Pontimicrobium sp. SW4 TaxID=3153519 RepID=A0AAU7BUV0_9FLAO